MSRKKYVITTLDNYTTAVIFEEDKPALINMYDKEEEALLGNVYIGRVKDVVKNINSAFVQIDKDRVCYYSLTDNTHHNFLNRKNTDKVCQGDLMLVQVSKEAVKSKVPSLTSDISITGNYVVMSFDGRGQVAVSAKIKDEAFRSSIHEKLIPLVKETGKRISLVVRTAAYTADIADVLKEADSMAQLEAEMNTKSTSRPAFTCLYKKEDAYIADLRECKLTQEDIIITDEPEILDNIIRFLPEYRCIIRLYDDKLLPLYKCYDFEKIIREAVNPHVWLKSGAYLIIEPTEALTVIDVNTGKFDGNKKNREDTFFKINMEAATEICRQLKVRNISGIVIVDFINMESEENNALLINHINEELAKDNVPAFYIEMTKLGLVEITRKKIKRPLHEVLKKFTHI